jgi:hypothetical protein
LAEVFFTHRVKFRPTQSYPYPVHPAINQTMDLAEALVSLAWRLQRVAVQLPPPRTTRPRGSKLRPGPLTPLWNALVLTVRPHLQYWGAQSNLARMLGVPAQRVHDYFVRQSAMPDAERVLLLLGWLAQGAPRLTCSDLRRR